MLCLGVEVEILLVERPISACCSVGACVAVDVAAAALKCAHGLEQRLELDRVGGGEHARLEEVDELLRARPVEALALELEELDDLLDRLHRAVDHARRRRRRLRCL